MKKVSNAKKLGDIHVFYIFFIVFIIKSPVEFPVLDEKNPFHDHGPGISSFHHEEIVIILTSLKSIQSKEKFTKKFQILKMNRPKALLSYTISF